MKEKQMSEIKDELENPDFAVDRTQKLAGQLDRIEKIYGLTRRRLLKIEEEAEIETDIDRKIKEIEAGFFRFGEKVLPLIETIDDSRLRQLLKMPFDIVLHNAKVNKQRNVQTLVRNIGHGADNYYVNGCTRQFFYEFKKMSLGGFVASFISLSRKIILLEEFDSNNDVDNLIFFHEVMHSCYDSNVRSKLKSEEQWRAYYAFFECEEDGAMSRIDITEEAAVVARELEVLNLLLDGELKKAVRDGGRLDVGGIRERLNAGGVVQIKHFTFLIEASRCYFKGTTSKPFFDYIAFVLRKMGCNVVISDSSGNISPYR